jgi:hypothetical protein
MARAQRPTLPDVTDVHRLEAFERMAWVCCSYEQAMANPTRRQCIEVRAHQIRTAQWQRERMARYSGRVVPSTPRHPLHLTTRPMTDLKRAAAGDLDD